MRVRVRVRAWAWVCVGTPLSVCAGAGMRGHACTCRQQDAATDDLLVCAVRVGVGVPGTGRTPLLVAVQNETGHYVETASLLLCAKADPRVRDERGRTALHVATANRNAQLITQLALPKGQPDPVSTQASPPSVYE